jgi:hypothetical protein
MSQDELVPGEGGLWTVEVYEDADGTQPFASWLNRLSEAKFVALDAAIRLVLSEKGLDLARTEWLKPLGEGLHEFRVRHDADEIEQMFGDLESRVRPRQPISSASLCISMDLGSRFSSAATTRAGTQATRGRSEKSNGPASPWRTGAARRRQGRRPGRGVGTGSPEYLHPVPTGILQL